MHFNKHLDNIKLAVIDALNCNKPQLIDEFIAILIKASALLQTDSFGFWIKELQNNESLEIPITKYAITDVHNAWQQYQPDRKTLEQKLLNTCEKLFTYWQYDDICTMQGQFYYYKNKETNLVFKQSDFGTIEYLDKSNSTHTKYGIALTSDLDTIVNLTDLYDSRCHREVSSISPPNK